MNYRLSLPLFLAITGLISSPAMAQEKPVKGERAKPAATPAARTAVLTAPVPTAPVPAAVDAAAAGATAVTTPGGPNDLPAQVASIFFSLLQKSLIDPAYEGLTKGSKIAERPEEIKTLKSKTKEAIEVFGPVTGFELVETKNVGTHLMRRTYLSLNAEFPLRWRFYFYHSDNLWRLIDLRVDDRVTGMFDEAEEARNAPEPK